MAQSDDPQSLIQQARLHQSAGRLPDAIAAYEQLLRQRPDLPDSWYNLARLQRHAGRYDDALAAYQEALDRGVSQPEEVHLNRGVIYSDCLRRDADAERELATALLLNPRYAPALLNLANLKEDRGLRDEALGLYERLLAVDPRYHEGLARYAALKGVQGADDPLIHRLQRSIDRPDTPMHDKASLGFALGKLLDGCAAHDQAFSAYAAANRHSRASIGAPGPLYDRAAQERAIDRLTAAFPRPRAAALQTGSGPAPIFICGMFRSGSTLAEQLLAGHSQVQAGGELSLLGDLVRTRLAPYPESLSSASPQQLAALADAYRAGVMRLHPGGRRVTDKRPDNFLHIGLIKTLFPDARIVHTTRNPLDNGLAIFFLHLEQRLGYALDLGDIGHHYREYRRLMAHWKSLYPADILDFDYDALVREPRPAVERLLEFCGLAWEESCMDFPRVDNAVRTASVWQVRQPLYRHASGRWRHYERHLAPLRQALGEIAGDAGSAGF